MSKNQNTKKDAAKGTKKTETKKVEVTKVEKLDITDADIAAGKAAAEAEKANETAEQSKTAEATAEEKAAELAVVEPTKPTLPAMTAEFCLQDQKYWEGKDDIYNPASKDCITCGKDFPDQPAVCAARTAFLVSLTAKKTRATGTKSAPKAKVPKDGRLPQSLQIDEYIKAGMSIETMTATLATRDFSGDTKQALARNMSHLKAIVTGRYCRAEIMKPFLVNLSEADAKLIGFKKPEAVAEPAAAAAT